jgi:hypothetical protein
MAVQHKPEGRRITDWIVAIFTAALFVTSYLQWAAITGQLKVMERDERPWIGMKDIVTNGPIRTNTQTGIMITIANFGKSPAFLKYQVMEARLMKGDFPDSITYTQPQPSGYDKEREPMFPGDVGMKLTMNTPYLTDVDMDDLIHGKQKLYVFGEVKYTDTTDAKALHTTRFCGYLIPNMVPTALVGCHGPFAFAD